MDDQTEAKKIRVALKQTKGTREYARVVAVNMVCVKGFAASAAADALGVDRGTVSDWLDAYARNGLGGLAYDARPGRPPFVPRAELEKIVGGAKRFTAYEFVELVEKRTGVKYSEPHARRLLRSLGFAVKKTPRISDRVPSREELETWQKDVEKTLRTTVPIALVRMLNLREGSVLEWDVKVRDGQMVVLVRPAEASPK